MKYKIIENVVVIDEIQEFIGNSSTSFVVGKKNDYTYFVISHESLSGHVRYIEFRDDSGDNILACGVLCVNPGEAKLLLMPMKTGVSFDGIIKQLRYELPETVGSLTMKIEL